MIPFLLYSGRKVSNFGSVQKNVFVLGYVFTYLYFGLLTDLCPTKY